MLGRCSAHVTVTMKCRKLFLVCVSMAKRRRWVLSSNRRCVICSFEKLAVLLKPHVYLQSTPGFPSAPISSKEYEETTFEKSSYHHSFHVPNFYTFLLSFFLFFFLIFVVWSGCYQSVFFACVCVREGKFVAYYPFGRTMAAKE